MRLAVRAFFVRAGQRLLPAAESETTPESAVQDAIEAKGEGDAVAVTALSAQPSQSGDVLAELEAQVEKSAAGDPAQ